VWEEGDIGFVSVSFLKSEFRLGETSRAKKGGIWEGSLGGKAEPSLCTLRPGVNTTAGLIVPLSVTFGFGGLRNAILPRFTFSTGPQAKNVIFPI